MNTDSLNIFCYFKGDDPDAIAEGRQKLQALFKE